MPNEDEGPAWQRDHARAMELADEMELDEDETDGFIERWMTKKGYKPVKSWADPEPQQQGGGSEFSFRKSQRQTRDVPPPGRRSSGQY